MNYYGVRSVLLSSKKAISVARPSDSFGVQAPEARPYIEPQFEKVIFESEKPTVLLVSAVGATGKTALARQLSRDTGLPILDLAKHKPVGDNSLTGLLTSAYEPTEIGAVLQGLSDGSYGLIIDGLDEGRSKTTAKAFEAFLDDIVNLCKASPTTAIVALGRSQSLDDCWSYLTEAGIATGLITISPFDEAAACNYVDTFTGGLKSQYAEQYVEVRDYIIGQLSRAFGADSPSGQSSFLSFIGYPPVLDSVVTLLTEEKNYHWLKLRLAGVEGGVEVDLLKRIADYILDRERIDKVLGNIVEPLMRDVPANISAAARSEAFLGEEQSARLVSYCLNSDLTLDVIPEVGLNEKYESQISEWLPDHPFLEGREFRNAVFEALALATLMLSGSQDFHDLVRRYTSSHKHSYHLIYMLEATPGEHCLPSMHVSDVVASAMEFRSVHSQVEIRLDGPAPEDDVSSTTSEAVDIEIEVRVDNDSELPRVFKFCTDVRGEDSLELGPRLGGAFVTLPCDVVLGNGRELEIVAPLELLAKSIRVDAVELTLRPSNTRAGDGECILESQTLQSNVDAVMTNGVPFHLAVSDATGVTYPLVQYLERSSRPILDPQLNQKYLRLRRILVEFRSHSKGALAKYRPKIEHERVLHGELGRTILTRLLSDGVLTAKGEFYYLDPDGLRDHIGVSWEDLRRGKMPDSLVDYLKSLG